MKRTFLLTLTAWLATSVFPVHAAEKTKSAASPATCTEGATTYKSAWNGFSSSKPVVHRLRPIADCVPDEASYSTFVGNVPQRPDGVFVLTQGALVLSRRSLDANGRRDHQLASQQPARFRARDLAWRFAVAQTERRTRNFVFFNHVSENHHGPLEVALMAVANGAWHHDLAYTGRGLSILSAGPMLGGLSDEVKIGRLAYGDHTLHLQVAVQRKEIRANNDDPYLPLVEVPLEPLRPGLYTLKVTWRFESSAPEAKREPPLVQSSSFCICRF